MWFARKALRVMVLLTAIAPAGASAQEAINYASIAGRVFDETGGVVPGAQVSARHIDTNTSTSAMTDGQGRFRFAYLRAGTYELSVELAGFQRKTTRVPAAAAAAFELAITLVLDPRNETVVTHADDWAYLESARTQTATTIGRTEAAAIPLNGRQFLDLALLAPGVSPTNVGGGTQLFPETSAVPGVGLSVGSQRNLSNNFMVDGLSANDDAAALSGLAYGVDAIQDLQVVSSGGQAELGRALGGHINVTTRSGTNELRADGSLFFRDDRLNSRNALTGDRLPMRQDQFGGSLGGPLARDKAFFFANAESRRLDQSGLVTIGLGADGRPDPSVVDRINERLVTSGYRGPFVTAGVYANPVDTTYGLGKIDLVGERVSTTIRYSLYRAHSENARGVGGISASSAAAGVDNLDQAIAVSHLRAWPTSILEVRGQVSRGDLDAPPSDLAGPTVTIAGVATFGRLSTSPTARLNTLSQLVANLRREKGDHGLRAGADVVVNDDTITFPRTVRGGYSFSSLANFLAGTYNTSGFTQTFGAMDVSQTNPNLGIYVQDEWRATSSITINAGVRYDLQWLETTDIDRDNLSPRAGIAWSPRRSRLVIRANAGRFYDRLPLRAVANALLSAGNTMDIAKLRQTNVSLSPGQSGAPVFPAILESAVPTSTLVNFTTMDPNIEAAYSNKASVEIERQIGGSGMLAVGYDWLAGRKLIMQINQNVPTCAAAGSNNGCRPIAEYANNNQYRSAGSSEYDGLHLSFVQRHLRWGTHRVSYTFSKSMNNVGEAFFNGPIDPADLSKDWARSDDDQRHRLVISGALQTGWATSSWLLRLARDFQVSWLVQYYSALPFNITTGANTIQGTPARPTVGGAFIPRNAGEGSAFSTTNLRIGRTFQAGSRARIEGLVEAFNLFNRRNDLNRRTVFGAGVYPTSPAPDFGTVTVVGEPRSVQVGVRVKY